MIRITDSIALDGEDAERFVRASGPGGYGQMQMPIGCQRSVDRADIPGQFVAFDTVNGGIVYKGVVNTSHACKAQYCFDCSNASRH